MVGWLASQPGEPSLSIINHLTVIRLRGKMGVGGARFDSRLLSRNVPSSSAELIARQDKHNLGLWYHHRVQGQPWLSEGRHLVHCIVCRGLVLHTCGCVFARVYA